MPSGLVQLYMRMTNTCSRDAYIKPNTIWHVSPRRSLPLTLFMYIPLFPQRREQPSSIWGPPTGRRLYEQQNSQADAGKVSPPDEQPSLSGHPMATTSPTQTTSILFEPSWRHKRDTSVFWEVQRRFNEAFPLTAPPIPYHNEPPSPFRVGSEQPQNPEMAEESTVILCFRCF